MKPSEENSLTFMSQFKLLVLSYFLPFSKLFVWHLHIQRHILRKLVVMGTLIV